MMEGLSRAQIVARLAQAEPFDVAVIGGGATGLGVAVGAASRGLKVLLVEAHDFAKGTSSRATKLVHGGVRYLAQGNISLVREALRERSTLLHNAPHLAQPLPFVMPAYHYWEQPFYGVGLKVYDALAGRRGLGPTQLLGRERTLHHLPTAREQGLKGSVKYWDAQFDDARLALALARTAARHGAWVVNYCSADDLLHEAGKVVGLVCTDRETGQRYTVRAGCVINATGVWVDNIRHKDSAATGRTTRDMVTPSQGVHLVVDRDFLPSDHALMVPKTADGRVLFAVPWLGKVILGTTDAPRADLLAEPDARQDEIDFILSEAGRYLRRAPTRADVRSVWAGLRPLLRPPQEAGAGSTKKISREHLVLIDPTGLVTVSGGKWTTYRAMAQDVLAHCEAAHLLPRASACVTEDLKLVGAEATGYAAVPLSAEPGLHLYGSEQGRVQSLPGAGQVLGGGLSVAMVRYAARYEYARTVEDVLARRSRLLFLDARLAATLAPVVGSLLQEETGVDPRVSEFVALTQQYLHLPEA